MILWNIPRVAQLCELVAGVKLWVLIFSEIRITSMELLKILPDRDRQTEIGRKGDKSEPAF